VRFRTGTLDLGIVNLLDGDDVPPELELVPLVVGRPVAELPAGWHSTEGAEMGKMMVAEGIGIAVLPDYSVRGDPLERAGMIVARCAWSRCASSRCASSRCASTWAVS
jgi:hypothetical protein